MGCNNEPTKLVNGVAYTLYSAMQECCPIAPGNGSKPSDWNVLITSFAKGKQYLCNKVINNKGGWYVCATVPGYMQQTSAKGQAIF